MLDLIIQILILINSFVTKSCYYYIPKGITSQIKGGLMINHISFQGRFVKDPELKQSSNGLDYSNFSLAWSEKYGGNENICFLDCVAYRSNANIISRYFKKGDMVLVEGKLFTTKFKDKSGNNRSSLNLNVDKVHFCSPSPKSDFGDDSLPF